MKELTNLILILAAATSLTFSAACLVPPPPDAVFVSVAPPRAQVEVISTAPGPDFAWIRGYHRWDGGRFAWTPGRWERRPRPAAVWVDGHWAHHRRGWYWVGGHWR